MSNDPIRPATIALLSVVVPIFNEAECFEPLLARLLSLRQKIDRATLELIFVNDGSTDGTAELLESAAACHPNVKVLHFSRNFGHQAALTAGLDHAEGDYVCVIDADLQDPPEIIPDLLQKARAGYDVFVWFPQGGTMEHGASAEADVVVLFITNKPFEIHYVSTQE